MALSDYDPQKAAVSRVQSRLDEKIEAIRSIRGYSEAGRKTEMAQAVVAARAEVEAMKKEFVAERNTRRDDLHRSLFGASGRASASELIADRDAQDRAAQLDSPDAAATMLARANRNGDGSLARATAEHAFQRGWSEIAQDYADQAEKRSTLDMLNDTNAGPRTVLADSVIFRVRPPSELGLGLDPEAVVANLAKDADK